MSLYHLEIYMKIFTDDEIQCLDFLQNNLGWGQRGVGLGDGWKK